MPANPFSPGVFDPDQVLFCRETQLQLADQVVEQIENGYLHSPVAFLGSPGLGKTTILKYLARGLKKRHWLCGYSEASSDVGSAIYDLLSDAQQLAPSQGSVGRLLSRIRGFNASAGPVSFGLDLQSIENGSAYTRLCELFQQLSDTARFNLAGAALFLDEAQVLPGAHLEMLIRALGAVADSPIVLFMAALPNLMDKIVAECRARSIPYVSLSNLTPLDAACAHDTLVEPARLASGELDADALNILLEFAQGHPLTLQMLGRSAWNLGAADTREDQGIIIRALHACQAIEQVRNQLKLNYYGPTWRSCAASERAILRALARASEPMTERDVRQAVRREIADADIVLYDLFGKGIVYTRENSIDFTVPGFREFVSTS